MIEAYSFAEDKKLEFVYDYLGRRVEKKVTEISTATVTSEERFLYDGWNLVGIYSLNSSLLTLNSTHTWGLDLSQTLQGAGGVGGLLGVEELAGTHRGVYSFTFDVNGNVSEVLDDSGAVAAHYQYSPFGNVIRSIGTYANANNFRFSTKYLDTETGFYYYGYRHYDPSTGRWLSKDPLQEAGGMNLYGFINNSPIGTWDLLGLVNWSDERIADFTSPNPQMTENQNTKYYGESLSKESLDQGSDNLKQLAKDVVSNAYGGAKNGFDHLSDMAKDAAKSDLVKGAKDYFKPDQNPDHKPRDNSNRRGGPTRPDNDSGGGNSDSSDGGGGNRSDLPDSFWDPDPDIPNPFEPEPTSCS